MQFHWVNQMHYDALGDYIVEHIQVAFPHHDQFNIAHAHAPPHTHHRTRTTARAHTVAGRVLMGVHVRGGEQNLLKKEHNMEEVILPLDVDNPDVPRTNIFLTPGALQAEKLILLIQGSGAVRYHPPSRHPHS